MTNALTTSRRKETAKRYGMAIIFVLPFFACFIFFTIIPLISGVVISFFKYNSMDPSSSSFILFDNYIAIFTNANVIVEEFWPALLYTLKFALIAVPVMLIVPLMLAVLINWNPPGYKVFRSIIYLPSILSISTAGILFVTIFKGDESGLFNAFFHTNFNFLENESLRFMVMILLSIWWQTGTNFVIFSASLKNVPKSLYEACEADGGSRASSFLHVTLPGIKESFSLCLFNTLIGYLNLYGQPTVIKGQINANSIDSPMMLIQDKLQNISYAKLTGLITAIAVVFGVFVFIISCIERKLMSIEKGGHGHEIRYQEIASIKK